MIKKESIVLVITAVIIIIAGGIVLQSQASATQAKKQAAELNTVLQEKDTQILKLAADLKAAQNELLNVKAELDTTKKALSDANAAKANAVVQQPAMPQPVIETPQTVTK